MGDFQIARSVRPISTRQSAVMHALRAVAALLVLFEHSKNRVFGPGEDFETFGFFGIGPRLFFNLGHEAVIVFFVLSGLLVGRKVLQVESASGARRYLIDRVSRIYIVAVPAIALSWLSANLLMATIGVSYSQPGAPMTCAPSLSEALANLALLNKTVVPTICSNSPFWSIQNEMTYYLVFAAIFFGVAVFRSMVARAASLAFAAAVIVAMAFEPISPNNTLLYAGFWLAGAVCNLERRVIWLLAIGAIYAAVCVTGVTIGGVLPIDIGVAIATLSIVIGANIIPVPAAIAKGAEYCSDFSYSLYLFHMPVINAAASLAVYAGLSNLSPASVGGWLTIALYAALALVSARLMYAVFEARTSDLRHLLGDKRTASGKPPAEVGA